MGYNYVVLGAGRQGTAAAYDMTQWGEARSVVLADYSLEAARSAADRVNSLVGAAVAKPVQVDATDIEAVETLLKGADACLSAVPYYYNLDITRAAIRAETSLCDLGGHTGITRQQHAMDPEARQAGISLVPNCGQVPGMGTTLMVYAMELLDETTDIVMWDGGLPQHPKPPFDYVLTFNIEGLTNEYAESAVFLRDGKVTIVEPMTELETVEFAEPIGTLEGYVTGGGLDTMPWTFEGRLRILENKTLRYPGHFAQLRAFYDLGLWGTEPIKVGDQEVIPREVYHALFEPKVRLPDRRDMIIVRIKAEGTKAGQPAESVVELFDYYDDATGFTAMERCTGWSAAIVTEMAARGQIPKGAAGVETQVPARAYVEELARRGMTLTEKVVYPVPVA